MSQNLKHIFYSDEFKLKISKLIWAEQKKLRQMQAFEFSRENQAGDIYVDKEFFLLKILK